MQRVSERYKRAIRQPIRERGYIQISFGVINNAVQMKASIDSSGSFTYYSNNKVIFDSKTELDSYATFEKNRNKLDGSMRFLPRIGSQAKVSNVGLVGGSIISAGNPYSVRINFGVSARQVKGLTIDFGENYATDFDIVATSGTKQVRNNTDPRWHTEDVIGPTDYIVITVYSMKEENTRLRINSILFGYGLVYYNDSVISSSLSSYISPIGSNVPQIDFTVTLDNTDGYFDVDNPISAINFLETGQVLNVMYGYELPLEDGEGDPEIEWIQGAKLYCSKWQSNDSTATISGQDVFRSMDSEYYKGVYSPNGESFYNLAKAVLDDHGETDYYIDPKLKTLYTKNPIPRVKHKEALQIIANACRCTLSQTRDGKISIKSNYRPQISASCNGQLSYSDVSQVLNGNKKYEYASFSNSYTRLDGTMYFVPRTAPPSYEVGYISSYISDSNGQFVTNPVVTLLQDAQHAYYSMRLVFAEPLPSEFVVRTYNDNVLVETISFPNEDCPEITKDTYVPHEFYDFDKMEIEFTKTKLPYSRIFLQNIYFDDVSDFVITLDDIIGSPVAKKLENIQEIVVPCYNYTEGGEREDLLSKEVEVAQNDTDIFYFPEPCYDYSAEFDGSTSNVTILNSGSYYAEVKFLISGKHDLKISGRKYRKSEQYASNKIYSHSQEGKTKKWENPLISDMGMANDLLGWLTQYYTPDIEYEYSGRGYPELDVNDVVAQERKLKGNSAASTGKVNVNVYKHVFNFNGAFSGRVTAKRVINERE
ncbi:MAG: hypothetical protein IK072_01950 [Clostridia bacterium]|nr:hypothetical protein [Clostridia bacterium]